LRGIKPVSGKKKLFISYAREDKRIAGVLAHHLRQSGYEVWWDDRLTPGRPYEVDIQSELDRADKVIVIWSKHSASSSWVGNEARWADAAAKLIPIAIDAEKLPIGLIHLHVLRTDRLEDDFDRVIDAVEEKTTAGMRPEVRPSRRRGRLVAWSAVLALCAVAAYVGYHVIVGGQKSNLAQCNLASLDAQFDYQCYHNRKLGIRFVYPLAVLELDTTKQSEMTLLLRTLTPARQVEIRITRTKLPEHGSIRRARDEEERKLRELGFDPNHFKPEEGEPWGDFYVITGWKPGMDIFYYKRWFTERDIVSIEFDYAAAHKRQYDKIIPDMVKERFQFDQ
jgi:hypothetical protein